MKKTAYLFPGQGSQAVGMGLDFYQEFDVVRELFDMVEEISRINISKLCFKGPLEDLTETVNLQPAITVVNLACFTAMEKAGLEPAISAGHSLGEYSALHASGIVSREDTFRLVFKRGELMHREATRNKGAMHAIIGLSIDAVEEIVSEVQKDGVVAVLGQYHSSVNLAIIEVAKDLGVPIFSTGSSSAKITESHYPEVFRIMALTEDEQEFYISFANAMGFKRVAILAEDTDYGTGIVKWCKKHGTALGMEIKAITFPRTLTDFITLPVARAKNYFSFIWSQMQGMWNSSDESDRAGHKGMRPLSDQRPVRRLQVL